MYYITINRVKQGPLSESEVRAMIARGQVQPTDLCWREGETEGRPIADVFSESSGGNQRVVPPGGDQNGPVCLPQNSGLAVASLFFGICTVVFFPLFFVFMIPAVICGHVAQSRIKRAKGALLGGGMALAGMIMGYLGVVALPVLGIAVAVALPQLEMAQAEKRRVGQEKQREEQERRREAAELERMEICKQVDYDARQIAGAAQQYFMEHASASVALSYDPATGALLGPLAVYVPRIGKGYSMVPDQLTIEGSFQLALPAAGPPRTYHEDGRPE